MIQATPSQRGRAARSPSTALAPSFTPFELRASDGVTLAARHYPAATASPRGAVLLVSAMGVGQAYYAPFAAWLAGEGFHVVGFDYRGMGESRRTPLRDVHADVVTWAEQDTSAALRALEVRAPGLPITWIGHSLGGQIVPFVPDLGAVAKVITVAAGSGYWRENSPPLRRKVWIFWWGAVPLCTPLFGYFPGSKLGMVGDLPRGVVEQWRHWCLDPEYAVGAGGEPTRALFASVTTPMTSLSFTDDEMMSAQSTRKLHGFYTGTRVRMVRISPAESGVARVGHFGFFRRAMRGELWERYLRPELAER
jgi:predicted alpha/beta hydrolase